MKTWLAIVTMIVALAALAAPPQILRSWQLASLPIASGSTNTPIAGIVGWWKLDDGSGTAAVDSSGNGNNGTVSNSPTWTTGLVGGGLQFTGANQSITVPSSGSLNVQSNFTVAMWIKMASANSPVLSTLMGKSLYPSGWFWQESTTNSGAFLWCANNGYGGPYSGAAIPTAAWVHMASVNSNGNVVFFYTNGVFNRSWSMVEAASTNTQPLIIGNFQGWTSGWTNLVMDDVRLYNRVLTPAEISTIYGGGSGINY